MQHQADEGNEMHTGKGGLKLFVVFGQATKPGGSGKAALNDPTARQQHKTALSFYEFDHLKANSVRRCGLLCVLTSVALV